MQLTYNRTQSVTLCGLIGQHDSIRELEAEAQRLIDAGQMPSLEELLSVIAETRENYPTEFWPHGEGNQMELTPKTKPPLEMTIHQMFERLTAIMEAATPQERERFKRAWLEGAERMKRER